MARALRIDVGGEIYHCLNRAVGKQQIFRDAKDYVAFERILCEVCDSTDVRVLAYCVMPNHFHLVLQTKNDGDLSDFMKRLSNTHTQRYRVATGTIGEGPVYQGRYKSFVIQDDAHLFTVLRYVERNPIAAKLVSDPLDWKYASVYQRHSGVPEIKRILAPWPTEEPENYLQLLTEALTSTEIEKLERSETKGVPFGDESYVFNTVEKYGLQSLLRGRGRPKTQ